MSTKLPSTALLNKVDHLDGTNYAQWKKQMMMVFRSMGAATLIKSQRPQPLATEVTERAAWDSLDEACLSVMWACTTKKYSSIVEKEESGLEAWKVLEKKFEAPNFMRRVELRKAFYGAKHDPSELIDLYIDKVLTARDSLVAIGYGVTDDEVKDVILMNLDPSYEIVKVSILSQPAEPTLDMVQSTLNSASPIVNPELHAVKSEPMDTALYSKGGHSGKKGSSGTGSGSSGMRGRNSIKDDHGYRWCDPTHDNHCHRCGRTGHIAARCVADMPPEIKDWVLKRPRQSSHSRSKERSHHIRDHSHFTSHRSRSRSTSSRSNHSYSGGSGDEYSGVEGNGEGEEVHYADVEDHFIPERTGVLFEALL